MRYSELNEATVHGKTFYAACKKMFGGRAFDKGLTKDEIKAVEKSLGIDRLPSYLANAPTVGGYVVVIPPNHPDWKTRFGEGGTPQAPKVDTPVAAAKPQEDRSPEALEAVQSMMRNGARSGWVEFRRVQKGQYGWEFEVRDWGNWENPPDAYDEEDYDWQELSHDSKTKLRQIIDDVSKRYPELDIRYSVEEKNWIVVSAAPKKA